jgi:hypothetical protein
LNTWEGSWIASVRLLYDEKELRKMALKRQFGVDFESGDVELLD